MNISSKPIRHDGWSIARRTGFIDALRVGCRVGDACAWVGMSTAGAYALAKRDPGFAAAWDDALIARDADRAPVAVKPPSELSDGALQRRPHSLDTRLNARPTGIVAQENKRWA